MTKTQSQAQMTGYALPLAEATALGHDKGWRQRVLIYITRRADELLVFEHPPLYSDAGIQVPAGGVDAGETPDQTAVRETREETGLLLSSPVHLESYHWTRAGESQLWHYYWLQTPHDTPDEWSHTVTAGEDDAGMAFACAFVALDQPNLVPNFHYEEALPKLKTLLDAASPPSVT